MAKLEVCVKPDLQHYSERNYRSLTYLHSILINWSGVFTSGCDWRISFTEAYDWSLS